MLQIHLSVIIISVFHFSVTQIIDFPAVTSDKFVRNRITPTPPDEVEFAFIYESCKHSSNSSPVAMSDLVISNKYGLRLDWNKRGSGYRKVDLTKDDMNSTYNGFDDIRGIFDCTITVKLGPHDKLIAYQELIFGFIYWIRLDYDPNYAKNKSAEVAKLDAENTIANKGLKELQAACGPAGQTRKGYDCAHLGCVVITYANKSTPICDEYDGKNIGDEKDWFTRDDVTIRILLVGSFIGKDKDNKNVQVTFPTFSVIIVLDFTRLHAGPCENIQQFYCPTHGVCIKYKLACDPIGMRNCPLYDNGKYDEKDADLCKASYIDSIPPMLNKQDPNALQNLYIFWILIGLLLAFLAFIIINYCFWRPGYLIWRCGRIRNWFRFGNMCYKSCHSCSKGDCAKCCKTQGQFDTTEPATIAWSKMAMGDGFHLRENR